MPFTPFIGLSVIVHIAIIILHKFFNWSGSNYVRPTPTTSRRWLSFVIITIVFMIISVNAVVLVRASIVERHSIVHWFSNSKPKQYVITEVPVRQILAQPLAQNEFNNPTKIPISP